MSESNDKLRAMLVRQEALRLRLYKDSQGKLTIGIGRNIEDRGIRESEAYFMLDNDIDEAIAECQKLPFFTELDPVRQDVLIDMVFNMGLPRVKGFVRMLSALSDHNWEEAAEEMMESKWAMQVGNRAIELAQMVRTGAYP